MNINRVPPWVLKYLSPFFSLSYPTDPPPKTDSFHDSQHFGTGWLDICTMVGLIAAMAILRDLARVYVFEPFARWKLSKNLRAKKLAASKNRGSLSPSPKTKLVSNGVANGHRVNGDVHKIAFTAAEKRRLHRSVLRFAEQGWAFLYYSFQCGFGFVSPVILSFRKYRLIRFGLTVCSPQLPNKNVIPWGGCLVRIP
jgi:acyl-CoA-dependent ceramide synthase